jgi:hypothetical protein
MSFFLVTATVSNSVLERTRSIPLACFAREQDAAAAVLVARAAHAEIPVFHVAYTATPSYNALKTINGPLSTERVLEIANDWILTLKARACSLIPCLPLGQPPPIHRQEGLQSRETRLTPENANR